MENFDWTKFTRRIAINTTQEKLYEAWTKSAEVEKWFLSNCDYFDGEGNIIDKSSSATAGSSYAWQWFGYDVTEFGKITKANGKDHFQFTFAGECIVDVNLVSQNGNVVVELTQRNIPQDDLSKQNIRLGCATGWSFFLLNLKSVYEGGLDLRNKNSELKGMINN